MSGHLGGEVGGIEFCTFSCSPKAEIPCSNRISWPTSSEFNKFHSLFEIADRFFLVNLADNVKMH